MVSGSGKTTNAADRQRGGDRCPAGIAGFLTGNTARQIFNQVDGSVLIIKPEDFETPVLLMDD